jgi:hypothetical protein
VRGIFKRRLWDLIPAYSGRKSSPPLIEIREKGAAAIEKITRRTEAQIDF